MPKGLRVALAGSIATLLLPAAASATMHGGVDGKISFAKQVAPNSLEVFSAKPDGSEMMQLTHSGGGTSLFTDWSPDGQTIAFDSDRSGSVEVYTMPPTGDTAGLRQLTAGMGFEGALGVVCDNFDSPLANEFARTLREMELGLPRREALQNLKKRTEVPELSNFVLTLTQADALGMPVGRVLKITADEMRTKRQQWAREKAAKLPVKILFPLVLFIFPPVFVIVLGPAAAQIGQAFH
jgi:hypothetical protein